jgi:phosphoribulokinase
MSKKHPVIAITGSSGAGTTTVRDAFANIFLVEKINAVFVDGDSFRRYDRDEMKRVLQDSVARGKSLSHFGPEVNEFERMEALFRDYGATGGGRMRHYVSTDAQVAAFGSPPGTLTPWEPVPKGSDLLFYEGLHGGVVARSWTRRRMSRSHNPYVIKERRNVSRAASRGIDAAQYVDLLIGITPAINLEWIQKIRHDCARRGCTPDVVTATILRRMDDYIHFIVPQFSLTDINFQRMPLVDTSNPFIAMDIPTDDECMVVIRFREPKKHDIPYLLKKIDGAFMSRANAIVIPGGEMAAAINFICAPIVQCLMAARGMPAGRRKKA